MVEVDVYHCGHRNSKVESFLRTHNHTHPHLGFPRYYETCVVEWKGSLLPRNVIILDHSLILTQNPPKMVLLSLHLKQIRNIQVVADRHLILKSGGGFLCQHVELVYTGLRKTPQEEQHGSSHMTRGSSGGSSPTSSPSPIASHSSRSSSEDNHPTATPTLRTPTPRSFFSRKATPTPNPSSSPPPTEETPQVLNLYLYQPNSLLLNELFLFWKRHELKLGHDDIPLRHTGAERVLLQLSSTWKVSPSPKELTPHLATLHKALSHYHHLPRIAWKDWNLISSLHKLLEKSVQPSERDQDLTFFHERVSKVTALLGIFHLLCQATSTAWFTKDDNNNPTTTSLHDLVSSLVQLIFLSSRTLLRSKVTRSVVCNPRIFCKEGNLLGLHSTESQRVQLVTKAHNSAVTLLHEIMCIVHFSSKDKQRAKFMSQLEHSQMELYLKQSMTQVIHLLWPNGRQLSPCQTSLLYRHVSTAHTLIDNVPSTRLFLHHNFCEEFRYFVPQQESGGGESTNKIPDGCPLKSTLLQMCNKLRHAVIQLK